MLSEHVERIGAYIRKVEDEWKSGEATEHTYRPMLKELIEAMMTRITVVNEPKHIECGAPDYLLRRGADILGFIEAKDIGDGDLDGRTVNKEQFTRYKDSLDNLCFTDYLDFHFYAHGDFVDSVRIAEPKGDRIVMANDAELERFLLLIEHFANARPQHIASPSRLAQLMAGKARLLADGVRRYLGREENAGSMLAQQMEAFRNVLIHDIDADSFADIFAQTVTYGMFAARLHDSTPEDFSRAEAATLIPKTNPLLRQMFQYIAMDTDDSIEWIVDDLVSLFAAVDVEKLMRGYGKDTQKSDPLLHFYEDFLAAYDPKLRKSRGVWYTPKPVVDFIVRSVDRILERDFNLPGGLADHSKTKVKVVNDAKVKNRDKAFVEREVHRVQILDPAAGTGTFLSETVKLINSKVVAAMGEGAWQGYVAESLLPRLNGFEILMASYAMAHLKLDMLLAETGYDHKSNERLRVFLTNSLEPYDKETGTLFAAALSQEANEANFVKRDCPVMVVIGNPPYSGESQNKGEWISSLMEDYKKEPGGREKLKERNPKWLNDDYVKFLRYGQYYIEKNGEGVLAYICPHGYLDNPTFRGMRWNLLRAFDDIYVLNLHGNAKKKETCPDGSKDENVFDIMQGVSINIFMKRRGTAKALTKVRYADLYGLRESKYTWLDEHCVDNVEWKEVTPQAPMHFFVPKDFGLQDEYDKGFSLAELFPVNSVGVVTANDGVLVNASREELLRNVAAAYDCVPDERFVQKFQHRFFDVKFIYYDTTKVARSRERVMSHFFAKENVSLIVKKGFPREDAAPIGVSNSMSDFRYWSCSGMQGGDYVLPLYLYNDNMGKVEKVPNFDKAIYEKICAAVNDAGAVAEPSAIREFLCGEPVARLTGHEFEGVKGTRAIVGAIYDSYARVNWIVNNPSVGEIRLTKSGINDSIRHGFGRFKLAAFEKIPEIIRNGVVVLHSPNWKGRGYESFVVAAPVLIADEPCCAFVVINSVKEGGHRFYLHEVGRLAEIKEKSGGLRSGSSDCSALSSTPGSIRSLAYSIFAVNGVAENFRPTPEDVFNYIYGVLHTPSYREKYKEFLKIDFPRIPYPQNAAEFRRIAAIGEKLVRVHLLKDESVTNPFANPYAKFEGSGDGLVEEVKAAGEGGQRKVYINKSQWFEPVPEEAWNFYIGGYQPAQKWLKDRKGRSLTSEDQLHYRAIIAALMKTSELMKAIGSDVQGKSENLKLG